MRTLRGSTRFALWFLWPFRSDTLEPLMVAIALGGLIASIRRGAINLTALTLVSLAYAVAIASRRLATPGKTDSEARPSLASPTFDSEGDQMGSATNEDPRLQISKLLDEFFPNVDDKNVWLETPLPRFGGRSPAQAIEAGDAELVALTLQNAIEGHPD
jgi:hypothetical protein